MFVLTRDKKSLSVEQLFLLVNVWLVFQMAGKIEEEVSGVAKGRQSKKLFDSIR